MSNWGLILTHILQWKQYAPGSFLFLQRKACFQNVSGDQTVSTGLPSTYTVCIKRMGWDSGSWNVFANYCIMGGFSQPDCFICPLTHRLCLPFLLASLLRIYLGPPRNVNPQGLLPHSLREHRLYQKQKQQRRQCGFKCPPQKT